MELVWSILVCKNAKQQLHVQLNVTNRCNVTKALMPMYAVAPFMVDQKLYALTFEAIAHSSAGLLLVNLDRIIDTPSVYLLVGITIV